MAIPKAREIVPFQLQDSLRAGEGYDSFMFVCFAAMGGLAFTDFVNTEGLLWALKKAFKGPVGSSGPHRSQRIPSQKGIAW